MRYGASDYPSQLFSPASEDSLVILFFNMALSIHPGCKVFKKTPVTDHPNAKSNLSLIWLKE